MEKKENMQSKLLEFQSLVNAVKKDSVNPFYNSRYADINSFIEEIKPLLTKVGLVVLQPLTNIDGKPALKTILMSDSDKIEETVLLPENQDPQKMGSTISYYRRYALQSLLLIQAEDDDGNATKPAPVKTVAKPVVKPVTVTKKDVDEKIVPLLKELEYNTDSKEAIKNAVIALTGLELTVENFTNIVLTLKTKVQERVDEINNAI